MNFIVKPFSWFRTKDVGLGYQHSSLVKRSPYDMPQFICLHDMPHLIRIFIFYTLMFMYHLRALRARYPWFY